jgi:hypothetical protein
MRTFIQLKDGIGWASVNTTGEVEGSIEVESGTGDFYIKKKYENGLWNDADLIKYAEINEDGEIIEIKRTYYSSEVNGPILTEDTKTTSKWIDGAWVLPQPVVEPELPVVDSSSEGESNVEEATN